MPSSALETWSDDDQQTQSLRKRFVPIEPTIGLKVGAASTHLLAFAVFGMMFYTLKKYLSPDAPIEWKTFALHPLLMSLAFGLLGPIGAVSWRTYESVLGMSHRTVKLLHLTLMLGASIIGAVGVYDMWLVHEAGAAAQIAKGWDVHFQSIHSWLGMASLVAFVLQAAGGLVTFFNPSCSGASRAAAAAQPRGRVHGPCKEQRAVRARCGASFPSSGR